MKTKGKKRNATKKTAHFLEEKNFFNSTNTFRQIRFVGAIERQKFHSVAQFNAIDFIRTKIFIYAE